MCICTYAWYVGVGVLMALQFLRHLLPTAYSRVGVENNYEYGVKEIRYRFVEFFCRKYGTTVIVDGCEERGEDYGYCVFLRRRRKRERKRERDKGNNEMYRYHTVHVFSLM